MPTDEQQETMDMIKGTVQQIHRDGGARCRLCNEWFAGDSLGEILEKLGRHGEEKHKTLGKE